jgi:hypothetical protein
VEILLTLLFDSVNMNVMEAPDLWTLDELAGLVESALAVDYPGAPSGRVRSVPDRRAIRWYTTIGLVDRPAATRGRTALYAERHLLQLVAIKRRQAAGHSLAAIQAELAGAPDTVLRSIAQLPAARPGPAVPPDAPRAGRFWAAPAAARAVPAPAGTAVPAATAAPTADSAATAAAARASSAAAVPPAPVPTSPVPPAPGAPGPAAAAGPAAGALPGLSGLSGLSGLQAGTVAGVPTATAPGSAAGDLTAPAEQRPALSAGAAVAPAVALPGGVTLLLPAGTPFPTGGDINAIRAAAVPLLAELSRRGLSDHESREG